MASPGGRYERGLRGSDPVADRLSPVDHELLAHLLAHRVLTTPQLIALVCRPERSIDYRLSRLRATGVVDRTRPYAASGSAPFILVADPKGRPSRGGNLTGAGQGGTQSAVLAPHVGHRRTLRGARRHRTQHRLGSACPGSGTRRPGRSGPTNFAGQKHLRPDAYVEVDWTWTRSVAGLARSSRSTSPPWTRSGSGPRVTRHRDYASDRAW